MAHNKLLISEPPLQVIPSLAVAIGLNEAIILQQLHYWLENPKVGKVIDGEKWIYNSYAEWHENFPFWSESTIQRIFLNLIKIGVVISEQLNKQSYDRTNYYRINFEKLSELETSHRTPQVEVIEDGKLMPSLISNTETTTQTTTNTVKPVSQTPSRSAEDIKQMTLNAITLGAKEHAERKTDEVGHFPQDTLEVIRRVCELWRLTPPRSAKDSRYAYWIRGARELRDACGEFGLGILDEIQEQWQDTGFLPSSPASLVKTATGLAGKHRVGEHALVVDKPEELSYHWNSELSAEENERLMKQARERAKLTQETNNDNISQDKMA